MNSNIFRLDWKDVAKGAIMALLGGVALPVLAAIQTPGFDIFQANWNSILVLAANGGVAAFAAYILKNLFSDDQGRVFGKIG